MKAALKNASILNKEASVSDFVPYTSHITEHIVKLDSGDYLFTVKMNGASYQSADTQDLNGWHNQLNGFMRNIASPNVAVWSHIIRRIHSEYPVGEYPEGFIQQLNNKYKDKLKENVLMVNELYLSIIFRPQPLKAAKLLDKLFGSKKEEQEEIERDSIEAMGELISTTLAALDRYEPEILGCYSLNGHLFSEVGEFLGFLLNGEWNRIPLPRAEMKQILPTSRPFFGKGGLMSLKTPTETIFGATLAFQEYPSITLSGMLNGLLSVPFEFVLGQSFTFLSKPVAIGRMKRQQSRMVNAGDVAKSQIEAIDDALDELTSNSFVMGAHSLSLLVMSKDEKSLKESISTAGAILSDNGIKWAREDAGMAGAFWSLLPGNFMYRVRVGDITSRNFAGFSSLHNFPIGRLTGNQWGEAVTMFKTTSGSPYYFSFHRAEQGRDNKMAAKLDPEHRELANTVVIGNSGSGKTVLETFLLAQLQKFNDSNKKLTSVLFDKDLGASVAVRAMGGKYYPIKNGQPTGWNPFSLPPTPSNKSFLEKLVRHLTKRDDMPFTPNEEAQIAAAIEGVMSDHVQPKNRRLSAVMQFLDATEMNGIRARLKRWCVGFGPLGWLLDNPEDTLTLDETPVVGFDVTDFLDNPETRTPTIMYLMHRIESLFDGRRVAIFMDEFWKLLDDPEFEDFAKNKLVTIRKQDGFLAMFTQSPQQVLKSPVSFAIIEQTATKIFLPNPSADYNDYVNGFKLSTREFQLLKDLPDKSRRFLIKQGENSVIAELDLRGFHDELAILSGNTRTSLLAEKLVKNLGSDPNVWLPIFHKVRQGETHEFN